MLFVGGKEKESCCPLFAVGAAFTASDSHHVLLSISPKKWGGWGVGLVMGFITKCCCCNGKTVMDGSQEGDSGCL